MNENRTFLFEADCGIQPTHFGLDHAVIDHFTILGKVDDDRLFLTTNQVYTLKKHSATASSVRSYTLVMVIHLELG
jgi:hypothetical protein